MKTESWKESQRAIRSHKSPYPAIVNDANISSAPSVFNPRPGHVLKYSDGSMYLVGGSGEYRRLKK